MDTNASHEPLIELLYFDGCPNHEQFYPHVQHLLADLGIQADVHLVNVSDDADAQRLEFLGSPSLRINGHDVDPTADTRNHYALQCRLYRTEAGLAGTPPDEWVKRALVQPGP